MLMENAKIMDVVKELRGVRRHAHCLAGIAEHVKEIESWRYIGANVEILNKRIETIINELTKVQALLSQVETLIANGNYNDAKTSLIAIADALDAMVDCTACFSVFE
jgi:hypothetical protein